MDNKLPGLKACKTYQNYVPDAKVDDCSKLQTYAVSYFLNMDSTLPDSKAC